MDITQLRYFLAAAETLNYTRAAEKLYISRQALRQAIIAMEKEIGTPLFLNQKNKLSLTLAGEYLQKTGKDVVASFDQMTEGLEKLCRKRTAMQIGISGSLVTFLYPEAADTLQRFQQAYPEIPLEWRLLDNDQVILGVETGELDCGLAIRILWEQEQLPAEGMPAEGMALAVMNSEKMTAEGLAGKLSMEKLAEYGVIISYGNTHPLSGREQIGIEELLPYHCMGVGSPEITLQPLDWECRRHGFQLDYEIVPNTFDVFYRIEHENCVAFDFLMEEAPAYARTCHSRLENYRWEMGWLCSEKSEKQSEMEAFCQFAQSEYVRNRQRPWVYR